MSDNKNIKISDIGNKYNKDATGKNISNTKKINLYPNEEFFPYACYFDKRTILTQNGDLLQTIKIPSFVKNNSSNALFKLRSDLQNSLQKHASDTNISFWFNTVRKGVDIIPKNHTYNNVFAEYVDDKWNHYNNFNQQYANEVYITIIINNPNKKTGLFENMFKNLFFKSLKKTLRTQLNNLNSKLTKIVDGIASDLEDYKPNILTIINIDGYYFSEHCKFFSLLVNNDRKLFPLDINILGYGLANHKVIFRENSIHVYDAEKNTYMSIISLKNYNNLLLSELDKIIQLDQELIVTQSISFLDKKDEYRKSINEELEILNAFENSDIKEISGLKNIKEEVDKSNNVLNFSISQVLIQVKGATPEILEENVKSLFKVLKEIGVIGVREEMFMPTLYWSQLPANFNFVKRLRIVPINEMCQFVSLYNFPTGKLTKNKWGDAVVVLKTTINTPYFFSFHNLDDEGNTLIISPDCSFRTKLLNFLISESSKLADKIFYIDMKNRSKVFVNAMDGIYYELSNTENSNKIKLSINPFCLEKNAENINFIIDWINSILKIDDDGFIKLGNKKTNLEEELKLFNSLILKNINNIHSLKDVYNIAIENSFNEIKVILSKWVDENKYGFIFTDETDVDIDIENFIGFNLSNTIYNDEVRFIIFKYLFYKIYLNLDENKKTIIAVDEIWDIFDNKYMASEFRKIIKKFSNKNAIFVATTSGSDFFENSFIKESVSDIFKTNILLHNLKTSIYQKKIFNITDQESKLLSVMKKDNNLILIKHNKNIVFSQIKFDFLNEIEEEIFNSNNVFVNAMYCAKQITESNDSTEWLPVMESIIERYNKYVYENKVKEQEKRQIEWQESREQINKVK